MDSAWDIYERENHLNMANHGAPHGITSSYNVNQHTPLMRTRQDSPKEGDDEVSAATAEYGCQKVNNVFLPGHHAHSGAHVSAGDTIEGSSLGPVGSGHMTTPPRRATAHTPPSQQQQLKWQALMVKEWHGLCDGALQDVPQIDFLVETDKGFKFSELDDSFICQKKNHFQITVTILFRKPPKFLKLKDGSIQPIEQFVLCLEGMKFEDIASKIKLKQSKGDRTKIDFKPIVLDLSSEPDKPIKTTICRLHFSETTANNPRKRGKPNPDQKYFSLVVSLKATTKEADSKPLTVVAHVSERIIVRTSSTSSIDVVDLADPIPSRELTSEHNNCKKEIELLKSAVNELRTIVCDLQQRFRATEQLHHPEPQYQHEIHSVQTPHSTSSSLSHAHHMITDSMTVQHTTSVATCSGSHQHCHGNSHPHDFYH